ncbi:MAG TPA: ABC transporter ATP-binding protein [Terracidiphilus sp.]|nr:ABC transporter ATP-binding protein [Terracidiphilus sp.]
MATATSAPAAVAALPIEVTNLVKRFGTLTALDGVSLRLREGECLGLLGPNGAGKSTLIRSIVGRVLPDSGQVRIFGTEAGSRAARQALGWIPQEIAIYPRLTCRENLIAFGKYQGLSGARLAEQTAWCLKWAALDDRANHAAGKLSGGMKRRLNMAAGIIHRPRLVLMDEPTVGVDPQSRNRIFEMIEHLRNEGMAVLYTTHYMEEAERLCDRIAIIDHGRIIAEGTSEELVRGAFGTRTEVTARFIGNAADLAIWVEQRGGRMNEGVAQFTIDRPAEVAPLLEEASARGFTVEDVSLRRPNLESVFLHLTGRELRD